MEGKVQENVLYVTVTKYQCTLVFLVTPAAEPVHFYHLPSSHS